MKFTTTTEISRKGSRLFKELKQEAIVLHNNKNIWLVLGWELAQAVLDSGIIQQIREELWELQDKETINLIKAHKNWEQTDSISLNNYLEKYGI